MAIGHVLRPVLIGCVLLSSCETFFRVPAPTLDPSRLLLMARPSRRAYLAARKHYGSLDAAIDSLRERYLLRNDHLGEQLILARLLLLRGDIELPLQIADFVDRFEYRIRETKLIRAAALLARGHHEHAALVLNTLRQQFKLSVADLEEVLNLEAGIALRTGDIAASVTLLNQAAKLSPRYPATHFNLGLLYLTHAEYSRALRHLDQVRDIAGPDFYVDVNRALAYSGLGDQAKAEALLADLRPRPDQRYAQHYAQALVATRRQDFSASIEFLRAYLATAPNKLAARAQVRHQLDTLQLQRLVSRGIDNDALSDLVESVAENDDTVSGKQLDLYAGESADIAGNFVFTSIGYVTPDN